MTMREAKLERVAKVNALIQVIGANGRRFFTWRSEKPTRFELDARGHVWIIDRYKQTRVYTHYHGRWRGFSEGGTLRALCELLRDFISHGRRLPDHVFGPWPQWMCDGDPWGYGDGMLPVREAAASLGIVAPAPVARPESAKAGE